MIKRIGALVGKKAAAERMADRSAADVARATRGIRKRPRRAGDPRHRPRRRTRSCANSWGGDIVSRAGGRLLTDGLRAGDGFARISNETVVAAQPGHHHRGPARLAEGHPEARRLPARPTRRGASTKAARKRPRSTSRPATRCCSRGPTWAARSATSARSTCGTEPWRSARPRSSLVSAAALVAAAAASLTLGAVHVPLADVVDALTGRRRPGAAEARSCSQLRLPRTISALVVGAALGVAGALLQGALANPLASPDVIGVTGGAAFGAILILLVVPGLDRAAAGRRARVRR